MHESLALYSVMSPSWEFPSVKTMACTNAELAIEHEGTKRKKVRMRMQRYDAR